MLSRWTDWKTYPRASSGENIIAPLGPGVYEVRLEATGAMYAFAAVDNLAQALAELSTPKSFMGIFGRRKVHLPNLEYRMFSTRTLAEARIAAEQMIDRRDTYLRGAA